MIAGALVVFAGAQTDDGRLTEAAFTLDVARRLQRRLQRLGARVLMTRATNDGVGPCVDERAATGAEQGAARPQGRPTAAQRGGVRTYSLPIAVRAQ